jgi:exonuclease III
LELYEWHGNPSSKRLFFRESDLEKLNPNSHIWVTNNFTNNSPKGLAVLNYTNGVITEIERDDEMEIYIPFKFNISNFELNILAVWNFYSACKQGRFKGISGDNALEYMALNYYSEHLNNNAIVIGDWNLGPTQAQEVYLKILKILSDLDIKCAVHAFRKLIPGKEDYETFRHTRGHKHILDHIFMSKNLLPYIEDVKIDTFENVIKSDHVPLILDLRLTSNS